MVVASCLVASSRFQVDRKLSSIASLYPVSSIQLEVLRLAGRVEVLVVVLVIVEVAKAAASIAAGNTEVGPGCGFP